MSPLLDSLRPGFYKAALLAGVLAVGAARAETVGGVQLPDGAQKVGENRYRSPQGWEETLKYYRTVYPPQQFPRRSIVNQPGVKAIHIAAAPGKPFEGLNIYEANEEVRVYIVPKESVRKKPARAPKKRR